MTEVMTKVEAMSAFCRTATTTKTCNVLSETRPETQNTTIATPTSTPHRQHGHNAHDSIEQLS